MIYFQLHRLKCHPVVTLKAFPRARRGGYEEQLHSLERQRSDLLEKSLGQNVLADVWARRSLQRASGSLRRAPGELVLRVLTSHRPLRLGRLPGGRHHPHAQRSHLHHEHDLHGHVGSGRQRVEVQQNLLPGAAKSFLQFLFHFRSFSPSFWLPEQFFQPPSARSTTLHWQSIAASIWALCLKSQTFE